MRRARFRSPLSRGLRQHLARILARMTTAVSTLRPATVLVMGLGVAGRQALAAAPAFAPLSSYDVRPETKERSRLGWRQVRGDRHRHRDAIQERCRAHRSFFADIFNDVMKLTPLAQAKNICDNVFLVVTVENDIGHQTMRGTKGSG
jgi:hypothetical protein